MSKKIENNFKLVSDYELKGDQPRAVEALTKFIRSGAKNMALLGVTGSGKTFTMANVIARLGRPTLILSHNKTLAAQLFGEFKAFFPENAVEYFVSYYDYYQPEAYIAETDTFIEKDAGRNDELDRLRLSATRSLMERRDVIIVSSVSCIYGLGDPTSYKKMMLFLEEGMPLERDEILRRMVAMQYKRNEVDFFRGTFRAKGDVVEIFPAYGESALRIELFGDKLEKITEFDALTGAILARHKKIPVYPAEHHVTPSDKLKKATDRIRAELAERLKELKSANKLVEAQRLEQRTGYDLEMMAELGSCPGIENYSRHLDGRKEGEPPHTLLDYLPDDSLIIVDESHVTLPQVRGMYKGDRSRKLNLVNYGFRLPSALDNRPLFFEEFQKRAHQVLSVSATLGDFELEQAGERVVEQIIRPTGLMDPQIDVRPLDHQVDDLVEEIQKTVARGHRVLVTTLTKRMSEDLAGYLDEMGIKAKYLHSEIKTLERIRIIRQLRLGEFDVLVGVNLLREGLDLPEVALVGILDADKEGFLRSERSLIQTIGRAARNLEGRVILYAARETKAIKKSLAETKRRRALQHAYNLKHNITPESIRSTIREVLSTVYEQDYHAVDIEVLDTKVSESMPLEKLIDDLKKRMVHHAKALEFEKAAQLRDQVKNLEGQRLLGLYDSESQRKSASEKKRKSSESQKKKRPRVYRR